MKQFPFFAPWLLTLLLAVGCHHTTPKESSPTPTLSTALPRVESLVLEQHHPAYLAARREAALVARLNGSLQRVSYTAGSRVKEGDLLFVIEPTPYKEALLEAEAARASARAAEAYAINHEKRMKQAAKVNAVSQLELLQATTNVKEAAAQLAQAEAEVVTAETNLSYCYIRAPFAGRISRNLYDEGSYLNGAVEAVTLATLYKEEELYAYFTLEEGEFLALEEGGTLQKLYDSPNALSIQAAALPDSTFWGRLNYLAPAINRSTGTLQARALIANPCNTLKSGLYVTLSLPCEQLEKALLVKASAIGTDQLGKYLYLVNDSNRVVYKHIEVGELVRDSLQLVTAGLSPTDRYITEALLKVRPGMVVKTRQ